MPDLEETVRRELEGILQTTLDAAIPVWIEELKQKPWSYLERRGPECSQYIAEHGDVVLYPGKHKGDTAKAFNALAEGIAILSFFPGGVKIFGRHWTSQHPGI